MRLFLLTILCIQAVFLYAENPINLKALIVFFERDKHPDLILSLKSPQNGVAVAYLAFKLLSTMLVNNPPIGRS